jgi:hypothetical protein
MMTATVVLLAVAAKAAGMAAVTVAAVLLWILMEILL